jgi:hypothetical protein
MSAYYPTATLGSKVVQLPALKGGMMESTSGVEHCPDCAADLAPGAVFCDSCGKQVKAAVSDGPAFEGILNPKPTTDVHKAARWLMALAVIFALFGTGYGLYTKSQADKVKDQLSLLDDSQVLNVEGKSYTVAELRKLVEREVILVFGLNYFLAVLMAGLFFWARKSPFPAMVTGLCVYLAVIALNAVLDPTTLAQGLVIKFLFIGAMIAGIKAALAERDAEAMHRRA